MRLIQTVAWLSLSGLSPLAVNVACGQNYPTKPVRIVTAEAAGGSDFVSRLTALGLAATLGQPVIVENRTSGVIPGDIVAKSPPDGYTLFVTASNFWLGPFMRDKMPYDPAKDFAPVILIAITPSIIAVHPSLAVKSVKELISLAKGKPGALNFASSSVGSSNHLAAELFKTMAGINIVHVPYRGTGPALVALIAAEVQLMFPSAGGAMPHVKSGRLRGLAVTSNEPSALAPGLPTVAASGLQGYESTTIYAMFAPAKTPVALIRRLNQEIVQLLKTPDAKEKLIAGGVEAIGSSPEQLAATVKGDVAKWGKLIKDLGIRAE
ncbi:MAG: tripartite tricarboxylate transporter substrate binding protein [Betaproteobacteria bacterium]|nr:tripartite tricarboxylate transporter substrate binding protein [Betaproteobacteria bacterium]